MFLDSRTLPAGLVSETELCIIGGGAAGVTLAREFIGQAFRVIVLESGGHTPDPQTQELCEGRSTSLPYFPLISARLRYLGGTTNHWNGECRPLDELDFEARDGIPFSGWPFSRSHLEPFYQRASRICQLSPAPYEAKIWATDDAPLLPLAGSQLLTQVVQLSPPTRFGEVYGDELNRATNVTVYTHANVLEIETDAYGGTATRVTARTLDGHAFSVTAKLFVLAAGGIENPRLLLLSNRVQANGLGNQHDVVGRFFLEHLDIETGVWLRSNPRLSLDFYRIHTVQKPSYHGTVLGSLTLTQEAIRRGRLLNFRCEIQDADTPSQPKGAQSLRHIARALREAKVPDRFRAHMWNVLTDLGGAAGAVQEQFHRDVPSPVALTQVSEQTPNPNSRVRLSNEQDRFGQRRVELVWRLTETDYDCISRTLDLVAKGLGQAGLGRVKKELDADVSAWRVQGQFHHMGTTRMHADPKQGVVDADCRVHGLANLFVAGSSVFPTAGSGTPTLTIVALALRLADHIKQQLS